MRFWRVWLPWPHVWEVHRARCWIGARWCSGGPCGEDPAGFVRPPPGRWAGARSNSWAFLAEPLETCCACVSERLHKHGAFPLGHACWVCSQDTLRAGARRPPSSGGADGTHLQQSPRPSPPSWQLVLSLSTPVSVGVEHLAICFPFSCCLMTAGASAPVLGVRRSTWEKGRCRSSVLRCLRLFVFFVPWWTLCCIPGICPNPPSPRTAWSLVLNFIRVHFSHGADMESRAPNLWQTCAHRATPLSGHKVFPPRQSLPLSPASSFKEITVPASVPVDYFSGSRSSHE